MPPNKTASTQFVQASQKTEKSRELRGKIRNFNEAIRIDGEDLADFRKDTLSLRVNQLNSLAKEVERPSEQADDSEAFYTLAQRGAEMAKRVAAGKGRTANDFMNHLKAAYVAALDAQLDGSIDPAAFNWKALSRRVSRYFKYAPGVSCLLGPLDALPKQKKPVNRVQRKPVGRAVAPEVLGNSEADAEAKEKRETERNMETMWGVLRKASEGVGLLELVMNHKSFAQMAENIFTLSFLVHNRRARVTKSEPNNERGLTVYPHIDKQAGQGCNQDKEKMQFILAYSMADWEQWKRFVRPADCLMPHRAEHAGDNQEGPSNADREGSADGDDPPDNDEDDAQDARAAAASQPKAGPSKGGAKRSSGAVGRLDDDVDDEEDDRGDEGKGKKIAQAAQHKRLRKQQ